MSRLPKPIFDNIIVLPEKEEKTQDAGMWEVPEDLKAKPQRGKVMAVGQGKQCEETGVFIIMQVKVGDIVSFGRFKGNPLNIDGVEYFILKQTDLILIH